MTRETVADDTPAWLAMSERRMVVPSM
jgi:hypothetical protein